MSDIYGEGSATTTTADGTTVSIVQLYHGKAVILDNPKAPDGMRNLEAGRVLTTITGNGFQPHPNAEFALRSNVLRALADLMDAV